MEKALATRTLFLIVVIGLIVFFSLIIFWHYMELQDIQNFRVACNIKYQNFCLRCIEENDCPGDWDTTEPTEGCEKFNIREPTLEECKEKFP